MYIHIYRLPARVRTADFERSERNTHTENVYTFDNSVVQCVAVFVSVLQCAAMCGGVSWCDATCCSVLQRVAACCSVLQCVTVSGRVSQLLAMSCSFAVCCSVV